MGANKLEEKEYARILYVNERLTFKEISERKINGKRIGTAKTISKWCTEGNWDKLRKSLLTTRQNQLVHWYNQLEAINEYIAERPQIILKGKLIDNPHQQNIPTNGEADTMSKITSNIQRLETEIGLGEYVEVSKKILTFIQGVDLEDAKNFKNYIDEFINGKLKNG